MLRTCKDHLDAVGESYFKHLCQALHVAAYLLGAGLAVVIHALYPGWFKTTGSEIIFKLHAILQARKQRSTTHT